MSSKARTTQKRILRHPNAGGQGASGRPAPYRVNDYRWHCNANGFCVQARANLSLAERDAFVDADEALNAYNLEWGKTDEAERDAVDTPRRRQIEMLTPYIRDWNAVGTNDAGDDVEIAPPVQAGPDAFQAISIDDGSWLLSELTTAYRLGKGLPTPGFAIASEGTAETS